MISIFVDGPAVEPITLAEMKAYLRVDDDDDAQDSVIAGLIKAARLTVEGASRRVLIEQRWRVVLDRWPPDRVVPLPLSPLISVESIKVFDAKGAAAGIAAEAIDGDRFGDPPRIAVADAPEPGKARNGILIEVLAGYGSAAEAVPAGLRLAIKILVAHWFENRGDVAGAQILPLEAFALVAPFRRARL